MYKDLFSSFSGLLSLGIILFVIVMAAYLTYKFIKLSASESKTRDWE